MGGVTVRLVGSLGVERSGPVPVPPGVGGRKARRLLAVLAVHRGRSVPVSSLVPLLWPDAAPRRPNQDLATLVSRLRAALGPGVVLGGRDGYRLAGPPAVLVDLDTAARLVATAMRTAAADPAGACQAGGEACAILVGGTVLPDEPDAAWVRDARSTRDTLLRDARHVTAAAALDTGDLVPARDHAAAALAADPLDEVAGRHLMRAHHDGGDRAAALAVFGRLRAALAGDLGIDPGPATRDLFAGLLAEDRPPVVARTAPAGRVTELRRLRAAWSGAVGGRGALVVVAGEGGIGKTRLATELVADAEAADALVLQARCYAGERSLLLQPVVDALVRVPGARLRELAGPRAGALAALLPGLDDVPEDRHDDPAERRRRVFDGLTRVLCGLATDRPVLLLLDDVHTAGLATVELLHYLARHAEGARLLVVAVLRDVEGRAALDTLAGVAVRVDVGPLDEAAVTSLARRSGYGGLAPEIAARTRGHTLFVVETLRGLAAGDRGIPASLQEVVSARLRRAGPGCEETLRAGAVLGATVEPDLVAGLLDVTPLVAARHCQDAADARLLVATDRAYEFANDLVQEVVYATTPAPLRTLHHRRAADLLTGTPEAVARHAHAAGDLPRSARAYLAAGERAARDHATADAESLFTRALEVGGEAADRELVARALLARGRAREAPARYADALADFGAAVEMARAAGDRRLEMRALRQHGGHAAGATGLPVTDCTARLRAGLALAGALGARADEADLLAWLTIVLSSRLRFAEAVEIGRQAVRVARASGSERALVVGLDGLKNAYAYLGETGPLDAVLAELDRLLHHHDDLHLRCWATFESAFPPLAAADWAAAELRMSDAVALAVTGGYLLYESWFVAHLGWVARLQGRSDEAVALGRRALDLTEDRVHRWFAPAAGALLGVTLLERGEHDEAVAVLTAAVRGAGRDGPEGYRLRPLAPLAEATGSPEHLAEATGLLDGITAPPGGAWLLGADAYLAVARAWLRRDEPGRARAVLAPLLAAADRTGWVPVQVTAGRVDALAAARLGDPGAAAALAGVVASAHRCGMAIAVAPQ